MKGLAAHLLLAIACLAAGPTRAQEAQPPIPRIEVDEAKAARLNLEKRSFDLGAPQINFSTYVPKSAKVETAQVDVSKPARNVGDINTIGKVTLAPQDGSLELTITSFRLTRAGAAHLICEWGLRETGLKVVDSGYWGDLVASQVLGRKNPDGAGPAALAACMNRGEFILAFYFTLNVPEDEQAKQETIRTAQMFSGLVISNLVFADGKASDYDPAQMKPLSLKLGDMTSDLRIPSVFDVAFNDFDGREFPELALLRTSDGSPMGLVSAIVLPEPPGDFDTALDKLMLAKMQLEVKPRPASVTRLESATTLAQTPPGKLSADIPFAIKDETGKEIGALAARAGHANGKVYIVYVWTALPNSAERDIFFSRLPELTAQAMLAEHLTTFMQSGDKAKAQP